MTKFHMLHIFPSFGMGGQQRRFASLADGLSDEFKHTVVALDGDFSARDLLQKAEVSDFVTLDLKKGGGVHPVNIARANDLIKSYAPDLLATYNWGTIETVIANKMGPKVPHIHFEDGFGPDETVQNQKKQRVWMRRMALKNSKVVVPSRTLECAAKDVWRLNSEFVRYIPNGVDITRFEQPKNKPEDSSIVVGTVGALRTEKNYARLINTCAKSELHLHLDIYGDGPERDALKDLAGASTVTFRGETATPENAYPTFDIFALSSDTEQMPISLIEAMIAGLPCVATEVGDIASMVSEENRPFIVPLGDDAGFLKALERLASNPALRQEIGAANASKAKAEFSMMKMRDAHRAIYLEAMGRND